MIEKLKEIEFHDLEVGKLELSATNNSLILELFIYDEGKNDYDKLEIKFMKLFNVNFVNFFTHQNFSIEEINSFKLFENAFYKAEFSFLQGFSKPDCRLTFSFESCEIKVK